MKTAHCLKNEPIPNDFSASLNLTILDVDRFVENNERRHSELTEVAGFPFRICADVRHYVNGSYVRVPAGENVPFARKYLGFFLECNRDANGQCINCDVAWESHVSVVLRMAQHRANGDTAEDEQPWKAYVKRLSHEQHDWGWENFISCKVGRECWRMINGLMSSTSYSRSFFTMTARTRALLHFEQTSIQWMRGVLNEAGETTPRDGALLPTMGQ